MLNKRHLVLSIVIPSLNEQANIKTTIDTLNNSKIACPFEVIVVDGGSQDATIFEARQRGAKVIKCQKGRGIQLATGGRQAKGAWILFLHADTILEEGWFLEVEQFITINPDLEIAGVFNFKLDEETLAARVLEIIVDWRTRKLALPYGDQGLLISNEFYQNLEGHAPITIMEDVEIIRRIGRGRIHNFKSHAITSPHKYQRDGYILRTLRNFLCITLYFLGFKPHFISKIYQ